MHFGIDYGSKLAGTTTICFVKNKELRVLQSEKKKDADSFIKHLIDQERPSKIFLDAPLSLPNAYSEKGDNFFFRECDKELKAMSPMFLGGLTARAMKLAYEYKDADLDFHEVYPGYLVKLLFPEVRFYKKKAIDIPTFLDLLTPFLPFPITSKMENWHQVDGLLAWLSGYRFQETQAILIGDKAEGIIII